jgi:hypothetical protein
MVSRVQLPQALARNVRIDLGRGNVGMTQQELHHPQVGSVIHQMGGKCMAQHMWRGQAVNPGLSCMSPNQPPKMLSGHRLITHRQKYRIYGLGSAQNWP